jgi:opacity protein-like surface antigen
MELDLSTNLAAFPGRDAKVSGSESWTDLVVGLNVEYPFTDSLHLVGYADVGGNSDDDTYQLMATLNWEFSKDWIAKLGYREISWDYKNDGVTWDIRQSGSYLGLGYRF